MAALVEMFGNSRCFSMAQVNVVFMFINFFLYRSSCFSDVNAVTVIAGNHIHNPVLFALGDRFLSVLGFYDFFQERVGIEIRHKGCSNVLFFFSFLSLLCYDAVSPIV